MLLVADSGEFSDTQLYIGTSRASSKLVVIGPRALAGRLGITGSRRQVWFFNMNASAPWPCELHTRERHRPLLVVVVGPSTGTGACRVERGLALGSELDLEGSPGQFRSQGESVFLLVTPASCGPLTTAHDPL